MSINIFVLKRELIKEKKYATTKKYNYLWLKQSEERCIQTNRIPWTEKVMHKIFSASVKRNIKCDLYEPRKQFGATS